MMKIMTCSDTIHAGTGFSEELRHIFFRLVQTGKFQVYWVGLQHVGQEVNIYDHNYSDISSKGAGIKLLSGVGPPQNFGLDGFKRNFTQFAPDLFFMIGDPKMFKPYIDFKRDGNFFPFVSYSTLDGTPIPPAWKEDVFDPRYMNVTVNMTEWAMFEFMKVGLPTAGYIHHGINYQWWQINREEKYKIRRRFGIPDDVTLFINWDVNQHRKRQDALLRSWKDFKPESKKAKLFLYTDVNCHLGWNLPELIRQYDIPRETILFPQDVYGRRKYFEQAEAIDFHKVIAQMGDIYVSAQGGEGFGRCFVEAMTMGMSVITTDYAAAPEVCERGSILVPTYEGRAGRFRPQDQFSMVDRGIVNEEKFTEAMLRLYDNPQEREELGIIAKDWAKNFDYDTQIIPAWLDMLGKINPDVMLAEEVLKS